jgi:hypothetical protein
MSHRHLIPSVSILLHVLISVPTTDDRRPTSSNFKDLAELAQGKIIANMKLTEQFSV